MLISFISKDQFHIIAEQSYSKYSFCAFIVKITIIFRLSHFHNHNNENYVYKTFNPSSSHTATHL